MIYTGYDCVGFCAVNKMVKCPYWYHCSSWTIVDLSVIVRADFFVQIFKRYIIDTVILDKLYWTLLYSFE